MKEMKSALTTLIAEETDMPEVIEAVKQHVKEAKLPDFEVVKILWDILMDAVQWSGKNQQQNANAALRQVYVIPFLTFLYCTQKNCFSLICCFRLKPVWVMFDKGRKKGLI